MESIPTVTHCILFPLQKQGIYIYPSVSIIHIYISLSLLIHFIYIYMLYYVETLPDIFDYPCISTYTCPPRAQMAATKAAMLQRSMCARLTRQLQGMGTAPCFTCHSRIASDSGTLEHILNPQHGAHTVWQKSASQLKQHTQDHPSLTQIKTKLRRGTGQE